MFFVTTDYHATRGYNYPEMLTGGASVSGAAASEWVGNERGCGILNSMCQFGEQTYNGIIYSPAIWGS